ncbi:hypothetical protein [Lactobacillus sp. CBA3605]|uniref:hypothetical protein n=1 Tax=Lactobacillus sp. CBA3605 TaxID=2099788 RepID=UPI0018F8A22D|nr:hypothetical protein [Lactobacillus sp. CBA3605]
MKIHEFDNVTLMDGREAAIVEVFDSSHFLADVGTNPSDWDTISIQLKDIKEITYHAE